jgi:hypothetical protein
MKESFLVLLGKKMKFFKIQGCDNLHNPPVELALQLVNGSPNYGYEFPLFSEKNWSLHQFSKITGSQNWKLPVLLSRKSLLE